MTWSKCQYPIIKYCLHNYYYYICHPTIADDSTNTLLNFTMLMLLIHTYTPCVDYSPYQSHVFSNVIMCLTTSCVSDATLYVSIQSSTKIFVRSTLLLFLENLYSFLLMEKLILFCPNCYIVLSLTMHPNPRGEWLVRIPQAGWDPVCSTGCWTGSKYFAAPDVRSSPQTILPKWDTSHFSLDDRAWLPRDTRYAVVSFLVRKN